MSHFAVLVIGDNPEAQLAPYHEFECTGKNDQYVQELDTTEEFKSEYATAECSAIKRADGAIVSFFDDEGQYKPEYYDAEARKTKVPAGCEEVEVLCSSIMTEPQFYDYYHGKTEPLAEGETPDTDGKHKFGYCVVSAEGKVVKVIRRTNPCAKWDWYVTGGRYSGYFALKQGAEGEVGIPGVFNNEPEPETADIIRKQDVDIERMRNEAQATAEASYDLIRGIVPDMTGFKPWSEFVDEHEKNDPEGDFDAVRKAYHDQPQVLALTEARKTNKDIHPFLDLEDYNCTRDEYIRAARNNALAPFAFVRDGKWTGRGDMGWWAIVSNGKDRDEWATEFNKMFDELPGDTLLTLVDCHI